MARARTIPSPFCFSLHSTCRCVYVSKLVYRQQVNLLSSPFFCKLSKVSFLHIHKKMRQTHIGKPLGKGKRHFIFSIRFLKREDVKHSYIVTSSAEDSAFRKYSSCYETRRVLEVFWKKTYITPLSFHAHIMLRMKQWRRQWLEYLPKNFQLI
jgi:hypothetical protein